MPLVVGVDSSTQSCTIEIRDADTGLLKATGRAPHPPTHPPVSEQHPDQWWEAFQLALKNAVKELENNSLGSVSDIAAISVSAQCHGLVMLDSAGSPLRAAKLWNDTESSVQCTRMIEEYTMASWVEAIGSAPTAAFTITKLAWVAEHEPQLLPQIQKVLLPHDYMTFRLTGRAVTDRSDASGTGYFTAHESRWRPDLLERFVSPDINWADLLPEVLSPSEPAGSILTTVAKELGLTPGIIVGPGAGDQHAGALGVGMQNGDVLFSLGTSGVVMTESATPVFDPEGFVNGVADAAGGYLPLVCTLNSTKVTDTMSKWLGVSVEELGHLALSRDPHPHRPVFLPYMDGERSPNKPFATGIIGGLTNDVERSDLARSAFEGVLLGLAWGLGRIKGSGASIQGEVVVVGGGAKSHAYRQILADILQKPVHIKEVQEATARGACIQAAAVLRGESVECVRDEWKPKILTTVEPRNISYQRVWERYETLQRAPEIKRGK